MFEDTKIKIMNILYKEGNPIGAMDISKKINMGLREVSEALEELEKELRVKITKKNKYICTNYKFGKVSIIKNGSGFVNCLEENDIYIKNENLRNAINGDSVVVEITDRSKNEGKVLKVLSHEREYEVGQVVTINGEQYVQLDDIKKRNILLSLDEKNTSLVEGHKVAIKISKLVKDNIYSGQIVRVLGHVNDPGVDIISKAAMFGIEKDFPQEVMEEIEKIPNYVREEDIIWRKDLRDKKIVTIDGDKAKDFDDAVAVKLLPNGNYLLGVHISDVSYYVKPGSAIDKEAYKRGTSSYLADRVFPMLPHKLSNGICSLNEGVDRLTKTCSMEIDYNGNIVNYEIFNSVINSKKRMTYDKANSCLYKEGTDNGYIPFEQDLNQMQVLARILKEKRKRIGSIDFETEETKVIVDDYGTAIDIIKEKRFAAEKIIEEFMIIANETVAAHFYYLDIPFIYRVHDEPNAEKLGELINFLKSMNVKIGKLPRNLQASVVQNLLDEIRESPEFEIYSGQLLRCMSKAKYAVNNIGHFGLVSKYYTHFTSPIRRYPDLSAHRSIEQYLIGSSYLDDEKIAYQLNYLTEIARHSSVREQDADKCEREVTKMKCAEYMASHIGEIFTGKISSVTEFGFYVDIYNGAEGLVKRTDLNRGFYDKDTYSIVTADQIQYKIGDYVEVTVDSTVKELGQINLRLNKKLDKVKTLKKEGISNGR